ncbi:hypothetical protein [Pseudogracilibacillus auburnensis]|uniref:hypothetical protein n=1 Tax=Pseudogracilibacillus auburnensis TaxID=1494959 RepID=UPI001A95DBA0|nr:hypothetical protein [Pseudogracilibacillus auburnensis]MBO1002165.1 hypothetical protein [Pseudogracilibacillus auburnensis]
MKRVLFVSSIITFVLLLVSCQPTDDFDQTQLEEYEVKQTIAETREGDFVFRLLSEKEVYEENESVELYGEIIYVGDEEEVSIGHSASAILFSIEEKVRGYTIDYAVEDIGTTTTLKKGENYRKKYKKSIHYSEEIDPKEYIAFAEEFMEGDGFPPGYYVVNGVTDFFLSPVEDDDGAKHFELEAEIDFLVK